MHARGPAGRLRADRREGRRASDPAEPAGRRAGPDHPPTGPDADRGQELLRPGVRGRRGRDGAGPVAPSPRRRARAARSTAAQAATPDHRVDQPDLQGITGPRAPRRAQHRGGDRPGSATHPGPDHGDLAQRQTRTTGTPLAHRLRPLTTPRSQSSRRRRPPGRHHGVRPRRLRRPRPAGSPRDGSRRTGRTLAVALGRSRRAVGAGSLRTGCCA
jgi:hypothetical protein